MRLNHNMASMNVFREYSKVVKEQSTALGKITSGSKINSAKESANNISKSEKMRIQIRGLQMASRNVQDGVSMLQTAEGGLENINSMLLRMRELAVQGQNGTNTQEEKLIIQKELEQMMDGIDNIAEFTEFNDVKLLSSSGSKEMAAGANVGEKIDIEMFDMRTTALPSSAAVKTLRSINITAPGGFEDALNIIDASMDSVLHATSQYGALENRFETSMVSINEISDKITNAESSIRDVDIAEEIMEYSRMGILIEAGNAMMVQSNKFPQDVLRILDKR